MHKTLWPLYSLDISTYGCKSLVDLLRLMWERSTTLVNFIQSAIVIDPHELLPSRWLVKICTPCLLYVHLWFSEHAVGHSVCNGCRPFFPHGVIDKTQVVEDIFSALCFLSNKCKLSHLCIWPPLPLLCYTCLVIQALTCTFDIVLYTFTHRTPHREMDPHDSFTHSRLATNELRVVLD